MTSRIAIALHQFTCLLVKRSTRFVKCSKITALLKHVTTNVLLTVSKPHCTVKLRSDKLNSSTESTAQNWYYIQTALYNSQTDMTTAQLQNLSICPFRRVEVDFAYFSVAC